MKKIRQILALLIVSAMLSPLISCAEDQPDPLESAELETTESSISADEAVSTEPEEEKSKTPLPTAPVMDMDEKTFNIYVRQWDVYMPLHVSDIGVEEQTGDSLNDAAFYREQNIMEKLNCSVEKFTDTRTKLFINSVMSNDGAYDFCLARGADWVTLMTSGALADLAELTYFDAEAPWWHEGTYDMLSFLGDHYGVTGDTTMLIYQTMFGCFFNKEMIAEYGFENMYTVVEEGRWTLDLLYEMSTAVSSDLDSNGEWTVDDQYGFSYMGGVSTALLHSFGETYAVKNDEGTLTFTLGSEECVTKMIKLMDIYKDTTASFNHHMRSRDYANTEAGCFVDGLVLFSMGGFWYMPELREMEEDFGIIPFPKYDENQEEYYCPVGADVTPITCIPKTCDDYDALSTFMEWYAYYGYDMVRPEMIETFITRKVTRDEESIATLNYIFDNRFYDVGAIYNFDEYTGYITGAFNKLSGNFGSLIPRLEKAFNMGVKDMEKAILKNS